MTHPSHPLTQVGWGGSGDGDDCGGGGDDGGGDDEDGDGVDLVHSCPFDCRCTRVAWRDKLAIEIK